LNKRLEKGCYEIPELKSGLSQQIKVEELLFILQGVVLKTIKQRTRYTHKINNEL
jgi:hypothetical protein